MTTAFWSTLEPGLSTLFKRLATVPGVVPSVTGSKGPSISSGRYGTNAVPSPSNPVTLDWTIASVTPVGKDELRTEYLPGTYDAEDGDTPIAIAGDTFEPDAENPELRLGGIVYSQHGQQVFTIEVRIESSNASHPPHEHFRALVGSMRLPSAAETLEALGLAYTSWDEIADSAYDDEDGRAVSVYIGRLYFNGSSYREDLPVTTIEFANRVVNVVT